LRSRPGTPFIVDKSKTGGLWINIVAIHIWPNYRFSG
jgi:hypothetical protein